ncbi:MAG TPA: DUF4382 domain-containing protein [Candidatus Eremiobacteraceae bacterium]|nr:DUF4382 domain-containing protein [Candidatus Eremiobacteraceae bacterium]
MKRILGITLSFALLMLGVGCSSSSTSSTPPTSPSSQPASVFVTGEDAPLASVVGFDVTINSITLNGTNGSPQVLSTPTTVDFARLLGLRSPLGFNSVPADTYNSATFSLSSPVISYVQLNPAPTVVPMNATFSPTTGTPTQTTVTVNFPSPMVVSSNGLAGLRMDFDIRQSVAVDGSGTITGIVNPTIYIKAVNASDPGGQVTDLTGGLVSVNAAGNSFLIQGPYGHQLTIDVNSSTKFNSGWNINNLAAPAIVGVQGAFQADGSVVASNVEVIATSQTFLSGRVLAVNPTSGPVQQITLWVGETGADLVSDVDTIQTINVSAVTQYDMCFFDNLFTNALFNDSSVIVGQRIFIGGSFSSNLFTPQMISLRFQGVYGTLGAVSIVSGNDGSFQLQNNGLIGYSLGGAPLTVATGNGTLFIDTTGLSGLQSSGSIPVVAGGLLFVDPLTQTPVMAAAVVADPPQIQ